MTEQEYIDATNLAKIRAAIAVLRDVLPMTPEEKTEVSAFMRAIFVTHDRLTRAVKCTPNRGTT